MGAEAEFLPTQSPSPEQMHGGLHTNSQLPEETNKKKKSLLARALSKLLEIIPLGILLSLLALGIWLAFGSVLGKMSPERTVTVQQSFTPGCPLRGS